MKTNIYRSMLKGISPAILLVEAATGSKIDFKRQVSEITGHEIAQIGVVTTRHIRTNGVESVLFVGFLLDIYKQLTASEKQLFENVLADCNISRTQGFRAIAVWRLLGSKLATSPKLMRWFVPEALKMLCEARVPDAARDEAMALAAERKLINIKVATEICERHAVKNTHESTASVQKNARVTANKTDKKMAAMQSVGVTALEQPIKKPLGLTASAVRLIVEFKGKRLDDDVSKPVLAKVIAATKRMLSDMEDRYAAIDTQQLQEVN